ncbi:DUF1127 domain-containing protein [Sinorhizobium sp. 7-81]|uniref:DUF1127 domain-containing protein n=1 Tax=Sinorhizobium sp. 8-89 TaxID=3049089 RepID=UPI0024C23A4A|nr:DUF1127 domain-containing protein [Sinorhizobium sp. 8-89]MDK1493657.1 DUF1127 domain-containing protein [Sinorhizobium sp. 8-89]
MSKTSFSINPSVFLAAARSPAFLSHAAQVAETIRRRRRITRARGCALHEMPDHILKDIGVTRFEVEYLVGSARASNWRKGA